jgi:hypothetical protein
MGPIQFALLWDVVRPNSRRLPIYTLITAVVEGLLPRLTSFPIFGPQDSSAYLVAICKLAWGVGILVAVFFELRRSSASALEVAPQSPEGDGSLAAVAVRVDANPLTLRRLATDSQVAAGCWLVLRFVGVILLAGTLYPYVKGDLAHEYVGWAQSLYHGLLPWRGNFFVEYPPGVLPFMTLPGGSGTYEVEFVALALLADAFVAGALWRRRPASPGFWLWVLLPVLLGPVMWVRLDVFVAAALLGFLLCLESSRWRLAGLCIAAAALLKLWPLALVAMIWPLIGRGPVRRVITWAIAGVLALVVPVLAWGGASGLSKMLHYQGGRGLESETLWAYPSQLLHRSPSDLRLGHGGLELPLSGAWAVVDSLVLPLALLVVVGYCWWDGGRRLTLRTACLLTISIVLVGTKVLSAQYIVWTVLVVALVLDGEDRWSRAERWLLAGATALLAATTQWLYPFRLFHTWPQVRASGLVALSAHALCLVVWVVVVIRYVVRRPSVVAPVAA